LMTSSLIDSIEAAKSTEPMAIIEALENWKGGTDANPYQYRKSDHQLMLRNLVVQVKDKITDKWDYFDVKSVVPQNVADLDAVFGTPEQVGCHMPPS
jgi:branched-chain amino acid transport system substrate-binding protein